MDLDLDYLVGDSGLAHTSQSRRSTHPFGIWGNVKGISAVMFDYSAGI